jgi:hypothetical protein
LASQVEPSPKCLLYRSGVIDGQRILDRHVSMGPGSEAFCRGELAEFSNQLLAHGG